MAKPYTKTKKNSNHKKFNQILLLITFIYVLKKIHSYSFKKKKIRRNKNKKKRLNNRNNNFLYFTDLKYKDFFIPCMIFPALFLILEKYRIFMFKRKENGKNQNKRIAGK